jgi:hypothetical protein
VVHVKYFLARRVRTDQRGMRVLELEADNREATAKEGRSLDVDHRSTCRA